MAGFDATTHHACVNRHQRIVTSTPENSDLDLQGKRDCSDDISSASCSAESEMKDRIQKERLKFSPDALRAYFHFRFYMIPPGGTLDVIAANFRLVPAVDGSSGIR